MIYKTKISPRVIWLESDLTSTAPRVRANGKAGSAGSTSGGSSGGSSAGSTTPSTSCTATPFSNGYDEVTTYCYNNVIINNKYKRSAYVACNYVQ
jgi:hypothetical protein